VAASRASLPSKKAIAGLHVTQAAGCHLLPSVRLPACPHSTAINQIAEQPQAAVAKQQHTGRPRERCTYSWFQKGQLTTLSGKGCWWGSVPAKSEADAEQSESSTCLYVKALLATSLVRKSRL
jgi:hypothetical protein